MAAPASGQRVILVAVDRSQQAEQALDWYMKTIHRPEDHVILLHAPEGPSLKLAANQRMPMGEIQKVMDMEKRESEEMAAKYNSKLKQLGVNGKYEVVYAANPGEAIVDAGKKEHATMIIMGTRGMGTLRRTVLGSVSDYVVHHAESAVVICRH